MPDGRRFGLVADRMFHVEHARWERRRGAREELENERLNPDRETRATLQEIAGIELTNPATWAQILRRQDVDAEKVAAELPHFSGLSSEDRRIVIGQLRYEGYLKRSEREQERIKRLRHVVIPPDLDPRALPGLSREIAENILREQPKTLAEAERLPAMTPAALAILAARVGGGK